MQIVSTRLKWFVYRKIKVATVPKYFGLIIFLCNLIDSMYELVIRQTAKVFVYEGVTSFSLLFCRMKDKRRLFILLERKTDLLPILSIKKF